ncbi:MAG: diguanylate cyclase domain-containing protein, partial [Nevskiaceae bacterium]
LQGYVAAVLGIERFMRATDSAAARAGLSVRLSDAGPMPATGSSPESAPELASTGGLLHEIQLPFAGRDLRLAFELPAQTLLARRSWATWLALAGGLALTGVVGVILLVGVGREAHTEALVRERTEALRLSEEALRHEATHDHLTGLPNRALFLDRLGHGVERGRRHDARFGLLYMDIDGFKPVNDRHGHAAGDELLRQIAARLRRAVRAEDTVARLGGDEFGMLLEAPVDDAGALRKAEELVAALGVPFELTLLGQAVAVTVGASVGVALYPAHGSSVDELVHAADEAMYAAKRGGKNASRMAG